VPGIGVDGCRAGWLGVSVDESDRWEARVFPTFREVYEEWHDGRSHILVDVPIGLFRMRRATERAILKLAAIWATRVLPAFSILRRELLSGLGGVCRDPGSCGA
jgi:predicted RNase H-like nuclease